MLTGVQGAKHGQRATRSRKMARGGFLIASQLAKDDAYGDLRTYVEEVKRMKSYERRKAKTEAPETP